MSFCIQWVLLEAEFCLNRKQNKHTNKNSCISTRFSPVAQFYSALENGEDANDEAITFYMLISLYWLTLDDLSDLMIISSQSALLEWRITGTEHPKCPFVPS